MAGTRSGRIITFYSYKGGTGRSMAVANLAWILASNGYRVLAIDWDLEAPGLDRYFHPFLLDKGLLATEGVIDWVTEFSLEAMTPDDDDPDPGWFLPLADLTRYAVTLDWHLFPEGATLDLIPAGRQGPDYASKVNGFDWQGFYDRFGGGAFMEEARQRLRSEYDYVLIDSRTGVSDTSGICTVALPDVLAVCFTLNLQSIEGAAAVARSVLESRTEPDFSIFPVPMRVELGEKERLDHALGLAQARFDGILGRIPAAERERYWGDVQLLYQPYYAYEEILAAFGDKPGKTTSMLAAFERLTSYLTDNRVRQLVPLSEEERTHALRRYRDDVGSQQAPEAPKPSGRFVFLSYSPIDGKEFAARLATALGYGEPPVETWYDAQNLDVGQDFGDQTLNAIQSCDVFVFVVSRASATSPSTNSRLELDTARRHRKPIIPVLLQQDAPIPFDLYGVDPVDFSADFQRGLAHLHAALRKLGSPGGRLDTLLQQRRNVERDLGVASAPAEEQVLSAEIRRLDLEIQKLRSTTSGPKSAALGPPTFRLSVERDNTIFAGTEDSQAVGRLDLDEIGWRTVKLFQDLLLRRQLERSEDIQLLGIHLYRALFPAEVGVLFDLCLDSLKPSEGLRLEVSFKSDDGNLSRLPWEYLYVPGTPSRNGFFLAGRHGAILRRVLGAQPPLRLPLAGPVRVLLVQAEAAQADLSRDDASKDLFRVLLGVPNLEVTVLQSPSALDLADELRRQQTHILHLDLHAHSEGLLIGDTLATTETLAMLLQANPPWVVVLDNLQSVGAASLASLADIPPTLVRTGVGTVITVRRPVLPRALHEFSRVFYSELARGSAVDTAAIVGRERVMLRFADPQEQIVELGSFQIYVSSTPTPLCLPAPA